MKKIFFTLFAILPMSMIAQENLTYQKPPSEILELADFQRAPSVLLDNSNEKMIFMYRNTYKSLEDLAIQEVKLAGLRIDPKTNISSTASYISNLKYRYIKNSEDIQVEGLPDNPRLTYLTWSPNQTMMAFTHTSSNGVELWCFDFTTGKATKLTDAVLNANMGRPFVWSPDSKSFIVRVLPRDKPAFIDKSEATPEGPIVSMSEVGVKAQNRTYQDLLQSPVDEANFNALATSELYKVDLSGQKTLWKEKGIYIGNTYSPDGKYVLVNTLQRPYSYIVPYSRFPYKTEIYDGTGKLVKLFNERPLIEALPKGFMATPTGKRDISWRSDRAATLYWVEALDGGDPESKVEFRDEVFQLPAPFTGKSSSLAKVGDRFGGILWGDDNTAVLTTYWINTRNMKTFVINPSKSSAKPILLSDRNYQDIYSDPGQFDMTRNQFGQQVLNLSGSNAYLIGDGYREDGKFPFVDEINLKNKTTKRLYQSQMTDKLVEVVSIMNANGGSFMVRIQSPTEYPNYYVVNTIKRIAPIPLTHFDNPFKSISNIYKEVVKYNREDGLELSGTLYLPAGYDMNNKEKLPLIMWAYPTEYKDKASAGQTTENPNSFTFPFYGSPIYWVTRGYAVLDNAAFPIVGEGDEEPNDTYIKQLVGNAKATIDALDNAGYIDRERVAVGGHSYGAFMTANLLTHSDLFAAGIARSGAYNRTLTPFGFQAEERNYWEAPEVYNTMSPFMHVDKMKTPLLLIHGGNDNNSGTFTMQSERYFNALKGFGAPTRLVILPNESHGYAAKESVFHMLWEQDQWLDKYVKNKKKD